MTGWILILSLLATRAASAETDINVDIVEVQEVDLSIEEWSDWSDCSDTCGGCGLQNRSASLPNGTYVVHVRHCNLIPCDDDQEPCCEPFVLQEGNCTAPTSVQGSVPQPFAVSQNDTDDSVFASNNTGTPPEFGAGVNVTSESDLANFLSATGNGNETNVYGANNTGAVVGVGGVRNNSEELVITAGGIEIIRAVEVDILHDPERKVNVRRKGDQSRRSGHKRKKRRQQRDPALSAGISQVNLTLEDGPKKEFDALFGPEYFEYYYYYYY